MAAEDTSLLVEPSSPSESGDDDKSRQPFMCPVCGAIGTRKSELLLAAAHHHVCTQESCARQASRGQSAPACSRGYESQWGLWCGYHGARCRPSARFTTSRSRRSVSPSSAHARPCTVYAD